MALIGVTQAAKIANLNVRRIYRAIKRRDLIPVMSSPVVLEESDVRAFALTEKSKGGRPKKRSASNE